MNDTVLIDFYLKVQNHESKLFLALFEQTGLRYLSGGCSSGFNNISDTKTEQFLYMVKGKRDIRIVQVPFCIDSLNKSDVFILDNNETIYQWNPPGSNKMEQLKVSHFEVNLKKNGLTKKQNLVCLIELVCL